MIHPIEYRYGSQEMKEIFEEDQKLQYYLDTEAALAEAHARLGHIPREEAEKIRKAATTQVVTVKRVKEIEVKTKHDMMAVAEALSEASQSGYVHLGATSNDIVDCSNAIQLRKATHIVLKDIKELERILTSLAEEHIDLVCVGRTHGQHSVPTTYGMKFAVYLDEMRRNEQRITAAYNNIYGKMSGAVGTMASIKDGLKIQELVGQILDIPMATISNQIVQRDTYAELMSSLAILASTLDKIATEIRNLQRTEIHEVSEGFTKGQVGSSTMPHKKNPVTCEKISGLARVIYSNVLPALQNNVLWHERDLTNSSCERVILVETFVLTDEILKGMIKVLSNLVIHTEHIKKNLYMQRKSLAESVMIALTEKGVPRQEAHALLRALSTQEDFVKAVKEAPTIKNILSEEEIDQLLAPENYIGEAASIVRNVLSMQEHYEKERQ
ncbi:MAG: adenylosuccinate lyase [Theionarchaea archaeon]|nr:adenylosuccinate lyase [Theionarchaea archaeon]